MTNQLPVYILAGGRSSRFGSDKARAQLEGRPLIGHVASLLSPIASSITVVADVPDKYADLGLATIADPVVGLGPMGGLSAALLDLAHRAAGRWLLLTSCDQPIGYPHWLKALLDARADGRDAVAFHGDKWQPMPALYAADCLDAVLAHRDSPDRSMQRLLNAIATQPLRLPVDWPEHWQVNRPGDLERVKNAVDSAKLIDRPVDGGAASGDNPPCGDIG